MTSFQEKIGWKRMRKTDNKNYHYVSFLNDALLKIPTKQQKNSKIKKMPLWLHFKQKQVGKG